MKQLSCFDIKKEEHSMLMYQEKNATPAIRPGHPNSFGDFRNDFNYISRCHPHDLRHVVRPLAFLVFISMAVMVTHHSLIVQSLKG